MSNIPVSYFTDFNAMSEGVRRCFWREMALHGAKHLVLVSSMITSIMTAPALKKQLENEMDEAGLDFCDAHAPYGPLWDMSCTAEDERSAMKLKQKIALETAACGAPNNLEIVKYLVSHGAVDAKDKDGKTALDRAKDEAEAYNFLRSRRGRSVK